MLPDCEDGFGRRTSRCKHLDTNTSAFEHHSTRAIIIRSAAAAARRDRHDEYAHVVEYEHVVKNEYAVRKYVKYIYIYVYIYIYIYMYRSIY